MMTSPATIAVLISGFALEFQFAIIQSFLPSYLRDTLSLDVGTVKFLFFERKTIINMS